MAKTKKRKLYPKENMIKILLLVIVIWFLGTLIVNQIRSSLIQTTTVRTEVLEHFDTGYGLFAGQETVIAAPADGEVERTMAEGERVRKGNAVFNVNGSIAYTNEAGRVSYQIDGLEGITDLSQICSTDLETRYAEQEKLGEERQKPDAVAGTAYAKVINTFDDTSLYLTVPRTEYTTTLEIDQKIPVRFVDADYEAQATIVELLNTPDNTRYIKLKLGTVKETVFQQRIYKIELPYDRVTAIAIPEQALVEKKGETGIYYLQKGFVFWKAVKTGQTWPEQGLVVIETEPEDEEEDGLKDGDIIVTTPRFVHEGENIKY